MFSGGMEKYQLKYLQHDISDERRCKLIELLVSRLVYVTAATDQFKKSARPVDEEREPY